MADHPERRRILDMLASGQINADEAAELLNALDEGTEGDGRRARRQSHAAIAAAVLEARDKGTRKIARSLRIVIDSGAEEKGDRDRVAVTVPLALAKFAAKLIPEDVRSHLESEGIELTELLQALDQELPEGRLVDIDSSSGGDQGDRARIIVEVV
jgi:hypothetical protein